MKEVASWLHLPPTSNPKTTNLQRRLRRSSGYVCSFLRRASRRAAPAKVPPVALAPLLASVASSHIFTSHLHIFASCLLALLPSHLHIFSSCLLALSFFSYFSSEGGGRGSANETARNATLSHEMRFDRQKLGLFARNEV